MSKPAARVFSRAFKLKVLRRMEAGENVCALARELGVRRKLFYAWRDALRRGGPMALRGRGRPRHRPPDAGEDLMVAAGGERAGGAGGPQADELAAARERIAALERKIGQQQVALDFFKRALPLTKPRRRASGKPGGAPSTRSSAR
jgi:transposase